MGELLLVCSIITLVFVVFFIKKKKQEEKMRIAQMDLELEKYKRGLQSSACKKRYSRDDSVLYNKGGISGMSPGDRLQSNLDNSNLLGNSAWDYSYSRLRNFNSTQMNYKNKYDFLDKMISPSGLGYNSATNYNFQNINNNNRSDMRIQPESFSQSQPTFNCLNFNTNNNNAQINNSTVNNNIQLPVDPPSQTHRYRILKLEDYINRESTGNSDDAYNRYFTSPIVKVKNEITFDDVNPSLIKYINKEDKEEKEDNNTKDRKEYLKNNDDINENEINRPKDNREVNVNDKCDIKKEVNEVSNFNTSIFNELIPKKIERKKEENTTGRDGFKSASESSEKVDALEKFFQNATPIIKKNEEIIPNTDNKKFESFGDHINNQSMKSISSA